MNNHRDMSTQAELRRTVGHWLSLGLGKACARKQLMPEDQEKRLFLVPEASVRGLEEARENGGQQARQAGPWGPLGETPNPRPPVA